MFTNARTVKIPIVGVCLHLCVCMVYMVGNLASSLTQCGLDIDFNNTKNLFTTVDVIIRCQTQSQKGPNVKHCLCRKPNRMLMS